MIKNMKPQQAYTQGCDKAAKSHEVGYTKWTSLRL